MIADVRSFNRTVGAHIGTLNDHFLGGDRPYGEARLLWEIGPDGAEVRELRDRLRLDSGYVSRMLRSLEAELKILMPTAFIARERQSIEVGNARINVRRRPHRFSRAKPLQ